MALVKRTLNNVGDPIAAPDGTIKEGIEVRFQLVDVARRQPISLFDAATDGGEYVVETTVSATTDALGIFTVDLWPNNRGEAATYYKVTMPGVIIKPFYIQIVEGEGAITLLAAKAAVEAVSPQVLSLFDQLLASIIEQVGTATAPVTQTTNGLMIAADKVKLDELPTAAALAATYAPLASPALTGVPTAPTAATGTNTPQIATTAFVKGAVDALIGGAGAALDTLNELAAALGNDANFAATVTTSLAGKSPIAGPGAAQAFSVGALTASSVNGFATSYTPGASRFLVTQANSALHLAAAPTIKLTGSGGTEATPTDEEGFVCKYNWGSYAAGLYFKNTLSSSLNHWIAFKTTINGVLTEVAGFSKLGNMLVNTSTDNGSGAKLQVSGTISATGLSLPSASYTGTVTGLTTSPSATINYTKIGNMVHLTIPTISGISNATNFYIGAGPADMRPTAARFCVCRVVDNGVTVFGLVGVATDGGVYFYTGASGGAFVASGTKSVNEITVVYNIN